MKTFGLILISFATLVLVYLFITAIIDFAFESFFRKKLKFYGKVKKGEWDDDKTDG